MNAVEGHDQTEFTFPLPKVASWIVTNRCNLSCSHCYPASGPESFPGELNEDDCYQVVDNLADAGFQVVYLSGGEVCLLHYLAPLIERIVNRGMQAWICTNGWFIDEALAVRLAACGLSGATVSIDHPDADTHDRFRDRKASYARAVGAIKLLRRHNVEVFIDYTATLQNANEATRLVDLADELGVATLSVKRFRPIGRGRKFEGMFQLDIADYAQLMAAFAAKAETSQVAIQFFDPSACAAAKSRLWMINEKTGEDFGCLAGRTWVGIMPDGTLTPCPLLNLPIGNVLAGRVAEKINNSEEIQKIVKREERQGVCGECHHKKSCGGCRAHVFVASGDYLDEDPYCMARYLESDR